MLCISTKGRYATRILTLLAGQPPDTTLSKHEIAASLGLTPGYVQQLMTPLQVAGLTASSCRSPFTFLTGAGNMVRRTASNGVR